MLAPWCLLAIGRRPAKSPSSTIQAQGTQLTRPAADKTRPFLARPAVVSLLATITLHSLDCNFDLVSRPDGLAALTQLRRLRVKLSPGLSRERGRSCWLPAWWA